MALRLLLFALAFALVGCVQTLQKDNEPVGPERLFTLPPASLGHSLSLSQVVSGDYQDNSYTIRYEVEVTPLRVAIVGLSSLGVTLFTLVHEDGELITQTFAKEVEGLDPRYVLFDLYLTYWPPDVLATAFASRQMQFEEVQDGSIRRISDQNGAPIAQVAFAPRNGDDADIVIRHFDLDYRLRITNLAVRDSR